MKQWTERAACRGADVEIFYPPSDNHTKAIAKAKAFCNACPVKDDCRTDALRRGEPYGIWGGTTYQERRQGPERTCSRCGETKSVGDFYARPGRGGGFRSRCKQCETEHVAAKRARQKAAKEQVKRCYRCRVTKPVDAFDGNRSNPDGRAKECKDCRTEMYIQRRNEPRKVAEEARCTQCEETKPAAEFCRDKSRVNGLTVWCKRCRNTIKRERGIARRAAAATAPKKCRKCEEIKPAGEFYRDSTNRTDGLNSWCKTCNDRAVIASRERRAQKETAA